jgi:ribosomal protein L37AE/L43A
MEKSQLPFLTVAALAHLIKTHEVSPVEVVEAYLERIERLNPQLHAFLTVCPECGTPTVKRGPASTGNSFWSCPRWRSDGSGCHAIPIWLTAARV